MIFNGLDDLKIKYDEVHVDLPVTKLQSKQHISILPVISRILRKFILLPVTLKEFKKIKNSDVLYVAYPGHLDMPLAYIVSRIAKKPLLFDPMFSLFETFTDDFKILESTSLFAKLLYLYEKLIFNMPNVLIADTELQKEFYHKRYGIPLNKIKVVYLGANDRIYNFSELKNNTNITNVVYYGLYNPVHGVEYIIEAARVCKGEKNVKFTFVGNGQTYEDNFRLAEKYKLENITFYKDMTEKDSMDVLKEADIFLGLFKRSNTVNRSIPNKVVQGAALGKAVITQEGDVLKTVFTHRKDIYFCKADSGKSLAEAILTLMRDTKLRKEISQNASKLYLHNFTPKVIGRKLIDTCKGVLK
jgi:glycosyltransferase involved in cell wall biosynthesis